MNNNNEYNIKLYNSVFNNIYIRKIIFNHLNKFNVLYNNILFTSFKQWAQFKYKDYLNRIHFRFDYSDLNNTQLIIPENIKELTLKCSPINLESNLIPVLIDHIDSIKIEALLVNLDPEITLNHFISKLSNEVSSKLRRLKIMQAKNGSINSLPNSISTFGSWRLCNLKKNLLPYNLKRIEFVNIESFEDGCFPESLRVASLECQNPLVINQFSLNGLIELCFYSQETHIGNSIRFPNTIQNLTISCSSFDAKLPNTLKSLELRINLYQHQIEFPSSLEYLYLRVDNSNLKNHFSKFLVQSKVLKTFELFLNCTRIVDSKGISILPDNLIRFEISNTFNQFIKSLQLPSTLTYLDLGRFYNQIIDVNVLPSSLKTLRLGISYTQTIIPTAIPKQLKLLKLHNKLYRHPLWTITSTTHPNIVISCRNIKLYYRASNKTIRRLRLPDNFKSSLSTLQLQDKSSLEYLHLGNVFDKPIELSDLPINNNIKTLKISLFFKQIINLEFFPNLETIIIPKYYRSINPILIKTTIDQNGSYNYYNLKNIIVSTTNSYRSGYILNSIDINFYQFIKFKPLKYKQFTPTYKLNDR